MNNVLKIFLLLAGAITIIVLITLWARMWLGGQNESSSELNVVNNTLSPDIPKSLSEVAEEEYAIEFEATEPVPEIDSQFCNFVKEQCEEQGIQNCEDYKMCVEGVQENDKYPISNY
jgi:hypothetical protein